MERLNRKLSLLGAWTNYRQKKESQPLTKLPFTIKLLNKISTLVPRSAAVAAGDE
jgi:hypothetical protein